MRQQRWACGRPSRAPASTCGCWPPQCNAAHPAAPAPLAPTRRPLGACSMVGPTGRAEELDGLLAGLNDGGGQAGSWGVVQPDGGAAPAPGGGSELRLPMPAALARGGGKPTSSRRFSWQPVPVAGGAAAAPSGDGGSGQLKRAADVALLLPRSKRAAPPPLDVRVTALEGALAEDRDARLALEAANAALEARMSAFKAASAAPPTALERSHVARRHCPRSSSRRRPQRSSSSRSSSWRSWPAAGGSSTPCLPA